MKWEEAIEVLQEHLEHWQRLLAEHICEKKEGTETLEALEMAIKALKMEPCEDCISRQEVLSEIEKVCFGKYFVKFRIDNGSNGTRDYMIKYIKAMSSVQPEQKMGHWIYDNIANNWRCDKCGETPKTMGYVGTADFMAKHFKYCNHCGTKMQED